MRKTVVCVGAVVFFAALPAFAQVNPNAPVIPDVGATAGLLGMALLAIGVLYRLVKK